MEVVKALETRLEEINKEKRKLIEESKEINLKLLKLKTGIEIGNVVEERGRVGVITKMEKFNCWTILKIKKDGTIEKATYTGWDFNKLYDTYEDYKKALDEL